MRTGRPKAELVVTSGERESLERWARRPKTAQALAQRARIVLALRERGNRIGRSPRAFGVTEQMVGKWRARFVGRRLDGLLDEPRPGAPRRVGDEDVERVLTQTLETMPRDATHWSTRAMAAKTRLESVHGQPHLAGLRPATAPGRDASSCRRTRCSSRRCAISWGSTSRRPTRRWCCAWTRRRRFRRSIASSPCSRCVPGRWSAAPRLPPPWHDLAVRGPRREEREGGRRVSPAPSVHANSGTSSIRSRRRVPARLDVHLILDNYGTHKTAADSPLAGQAAALSSALHPDRRLVAQSRASAGSPRSPRSRFGAGHIGAPGSSRRAIKHYLAVSNGTPKPFVWTKTADEILASRGSIL